MADFDLSLVATFDTTQAEQGGKRVVDTIDGMADAEKRAERETDKSRTTSEKAAKAERDRAKAVEDVAGSLDRETASEKRSNTEKQRTEKETNDVTRAERERAAAIDAVRSALEPGYAAQKKANELLAQAEKLHKQGAISLKQLAGVQELHSNAMKGGAASAGQMRAGYTQLGFQIQDITQTLALGINPMVVFGQQAGQTAAAVSMMGGAAGRVGTFLSGPWGSLILAAVTVTGLFASSLFEAEEASDDLSGALDFQRGSTEKLTAAIREGLDEARKSIELSYQQAEAARAEAAENLKAAIARRERTKAEIEGFQAAARGSAGQGFGGASTFISGQADALSGDLAQQNANIAALEETLRLRDVPLRRREAEAATDKAAAATLRYERAEAALNEEYRKGSISLEQYDTRLRNLYRQRENEKAALREQEAAQRKANREKEKGLKLAEKEASYADFALPFAASTITSGYGRRSAPTAGASTFHQGVDFGVAAGTPVGAPQVGTVEAVGFSQSLGKYVVVDHGGGTKTRYGHLSSIDVARGDALGQGQTLGRVGSTGRSTGPHLHYEVFVNGKRVDPTKGRFPIDDVKVAEAAEKARSSLEDFGNKAAESIARVSERFDEQPRLIDAAAQAARQLDATIAELEERRPPGFEQLIENARAAKGVIADSLLRPFEDILEASERRMQIDELIAANREDEAAALQTIWQLEERLGPLSRERRQQILDTVIAERELTEELRARQALQSAYLETTRTVRQEVEAILSGTGKLSNLKNVFRQLKGKVLAEQLFGDVFRDLDKFVREETAIKSSVDLMATETERAGEAAGNLAKTFDDVARELRASSSATSGAAPGSFGNFLGDFDKEFGTGPAGVATGDGAPNDEIVVTASKNSVNGLSPERYFEEMSKRVVKPLLAGFDTIFGTEFFGKLEGVLGGAVNGYLTGGIPGGILGAIKGIDGLPEGISEAVGGALKGAQSGTMVAGVGKALGLNLSTTGSQIGGAIGSFLPIPGGDIIGALAGGLLGGLFKSKKFGTASISSVDSISTSGKGDGRVDGANSLGGSVTSGLRNIADALEAELGSFAVSIGTYKDDVRVSTTGRTGKLNNFEKRADIKNFGDDTAGAIAFAIADAIADGAIKGISPAVERALKSSPDIEKATAEALKVAELERTLKYMGDTIAEAFDDFRKTAEERVALAKRYGLDLVKVEELNAKERKALLDDALERQVGSLKRLVDDLSFGSLFEGSPAERRQRLLGEVADAKQDVELGVAGATDRLAELQRSLVETSRQAFGTAGSEFEADRSQALSSAQAIIEAEQRRIEDAAADRQKSLDLANETNDLLAGVNGRLDTLINQGGAVSAPSVGISPDGYFNRDRINLVQY